MKRAAGAMHPDLILVVPSLCHSYLQNCHCELQNYKNATIGPQMLAHALK